MDRRGDLWEAVLVLGIDLVKLLAKF